MNQELIKQFGTEAIQSLAKNTNVRWFVDANVLISGNVSELFEDPFHVFILEKVCVEVRKHPEAKRGNKFIDAVEKIGNVISDEWYPKEISSSVGLLTKCAKELAPSIRANTQWFIDHEEFDYAEAESRAIERAAVEGSFFECGLSANLVDAGLIFEEEAKIDKRTRKSWFEYPKKRRAKIASGEYLFTDESLVATSVAHSILKNEKVCILSADKDIAAIMKQIADNWIWSASVMDYELSNGGIFIEDVVALCEKRCRDLDRYRQSCLVKRLLRISKDGVVDSAAINEPIGNEVIVCRPDDGRLGYFAFSQQLVDYAKDIEFLSSRCRLIRNGIWMPNLH